jgi:hypothetical protein
MKPGATLGLSHGFLLGIMKNDGVDFRKDINVVLVAPKVRWRAEQPALLGWRATGLPCAAALGRARAAPRPYMAAALPARHARLGL